MTAWLAMVFVCTTMAGTDAMPKCGLISSKRHFPTKEGCEEFNTRALSGIEQRFAALGLDLKRHDPLCRKIKLKPKEVAI